MACFLAVTATLCGKTALGSVIVKDTSIRRPLPDIVDQVFFRDMVGMGVTAYFGGIGDTEVWSLDAPGAGLSGVSGNVPSDSGSTWTLFGLSNEDTFDGIWTLTNNSATRALTALVLSGSGIIFDATESDPGTPGTFSGMDFTELAGPLNSIATYELAIKPILSPHDAFYRLEIELCPGGTTPGVGVGANCGQSLTFKQDTDVVPVPVTAALVLLGLLNLVVVRRRGKSGLSKFSL